MSLIHHDLLAVLNSVEIESAGRYTILGEKREVGTGGPDGPGSPPEPDRIISALALDIYERLYTRPSVPASAGTDSMARRELVAALSAANVSSGQWEPGWTVRRAEGEVVVAARDGLDFWVPAAEACVREGSIRPGAGCRVRVPGEQRGLVPGFYLAIGGGDAESDDGEDAGPIARFYWHLKPEAAIDFMAAATSLLGESRILYRIKVLADPGDYRRADAGVLYVPLRDASIVFPFVARIHSAVGCGLRPDVPLFTKRLAPGLGFAGDATLSESFGLLRCQLVAGALWEAFLLRAEGEARAEAIGAAFTRSGLYPLQPHRGPGWRPEYEPELLPEGQTAPVADGPLSSAIPAPSRVPLLEAAVGIGGDLCRSAYWDVEGRRCNWIGRSTAEVDRIDGPVTPTSAALDEELYRGSAGIALFLAQLHALTGDEDFRRTALGGITRSIRRVGRPTTEHDPSPISFFVGELGIAYAAWRIAALTGDRDLTSRVEPIVLRVAEAMSAPHNRDVIGGNAGAIPALLAMAQAPGLECCAGLAIALGEELCRFDPSRSGVHYVRGGQETASELESHTPSGLSHGASGIGLALLELHAATGSTAFRDAARRAFAYEDTLFDPDRRNWADLRRPSGVSRHEVAWCNGAAGIALARLRASVIDPDGGQGYLNTARIGIATTLDAIESDLAIPGFDATPCHGLAGLIEIVMIAARTLGQESYRDRALAAARVLIDRYANPGNWPSGLISGGPNPSLMLGTAGIGYTFLRLHDPEHVPSVLWIGA